MSLVDGWNNISAPTVSVITVVFNGESMIQSTMKSVLDQDYPNIEYVVIDGGSSDRTAQIVARYANQLARFVSEPDRGVYDAMNKGLSVATGEFLLFMNCGDVFASRDAVSSVMRHAKIGCDQLIFGHWLRRGDEGALLECKPSLRKGLFNHQAVIYSRSIHAWHGDYLDVDGLTTADYLFFSTLFSYSKVRCVVVDVVIAIIDTNGLSAGPQTLSQKYAIDYLCARVSKVNLVMVLLFHPVYRLVKKLFRRLR